MAEGEQDLTSNFLSDHTRTPRTPLSGRKTARTPATAEEKDAKAGAAGSRRRRRPSVDAADTGGSERVAKQARVSVGQGKVGARGVRVRGGKDGAGRTRVKAVLRRGVKAGQGAKGGGKRGGKGGKGVETDENGNTGRKVASAVVQGKRRKLIGKRMREEEEGVEEEAMMALQEADEEEEDVAMAEVCVCARALVLATGQKVASAVVQACLPRLPSGAITRTNSHSPYKLIPKGTAVRRVREARKGRR